MEQPYGSQIIAKKVDAMHMDDIEVPQFQGGAWGKGIFIGAAITDTPDGHALDGIFRRKALTGLVEDAVERQDFGVLPLKTLLTRERENKAL